jgi:uncharacterized protein DUF4166
MGVQNKIVMSSPFSEVLKPYQNELPVSIQEQYLCPSEAPYEIVLGGQMKTIWHRPAWLYPVFWLLSKGDVLFPETGENIPTVLIVSAQRNEKGEPIQIWERTFHFPNHIRRHYKSTMSYDSASKRISELQGPGNIFEEIAEIKFTSPDTIEFLTVKSILRLGSLRLQIPRKLWITAHVVQQVNLPDGETSRVTLTITHGIFGAIFGYEGIFRTTRRNRHA